MFKVHFVFLPIVLILGLIISITDCSLDHKKRAQIETSSNQFLKNLFSLPNQYQSFSKLNSERLLTILPNGDLSPNNADKYIFQKPLTDKVALYRREKVGANDLYVLIYIVNDGLWISGEDKNQWGLNLRVIQDAFEYMRSNSRNISRRGDDEYLNKALFETLKVHTMPLFPYRIFSRSVVSNILDRNQEKIDAFLRKMSQENITVLAPFVAMIEVPDYAHVEQFSKININLNVKSLSFETYDVTRYLYQDNAIKIPQSYTNRFQIEAVISDAEAIYYDSVSGNRGLLAYHSGMLYLSPAVQKDINDISDDDVNLFREGLKLVNSVCIDFQTKD